MSKVRLLNARICPWSRPASLTRPTAPEATRNRSSCSATCAGGTMFGSGFCVDAGGPGGPPGVPAPLNWARTSLSSRRLAGGTMVTASDSGLPIITIFPLTAARCCSKNAVSCSLVGRCGISSGRIGAVTGPFVPGVQASASTTSASLTGETTCTESLSFNQPGWPNSHGSSCAFFSPQAVASFTTHSAAPFRLGEPVRRGPYTSVSTCSVLMIRELSVASRRILQLTSRSSDSCAVGDEVAVRTTIDRMARIRTRMGNS